MLSVYLPAAIVAFLVTLLEMTEVVALVFAIGADAPSIRPGVGGAIAGVAVIALVAIGFGALLAAIPSPYFLGAAAVVLAAFGVYMFRGTLRAYRRAARGDTAGPPAHRALQFGGGFTVGAIEATEAIIVLLALAVAGYAFSAVIGAVVAGVLLAAAAAVVHERIRRIKVRLLRLGGTSFVITFAIFWAGEALGVRWPGGDLVLVPLVILVGLVVRGAIALGLPRAPAPPPSVSPPAGW
jgi:Ca2+/H+ antiporter, TMEM165/GDT1 family